MVASLDTLGKVAEVIEKYVAEEDLADFMLELLAIPGNKSFKDSVLALDEIIGS